MQSDWLTEIAVERAPAPASGAGVLQPV
jgi:hypothetical protein